MEKMKGTPDIKHVNKSTDAEGNFWEMVKVKRKKCRP